MWKFSLYGTGHVSELSSLKISYLSPVSLSSSFFNLLEPISFFNSSLRSSFGIYISRFFFLNSLFSLLNSFMLSSAMPEISPISFVPSKFADWVLSKNYLFFCDIDNIFFINLIIYEFCSLLFTICPVIIYITSSHFSFSSSFSLLISSWISDSSYCDLLVIEPS